MTDLDVEYPLIVSPENLATGAEIDFSWNDGINTRTIQVRIPSGTPPRARLRIRGGGRSGNAGQIGDLYLLLTVQAGSGIHSGANKQIFLAGLVLVAAGAALIAWTEYSTRTPGAYRFDFPLLGPLTAMIGFFLVHWPKMRLQGMALVGFYALYRWIIPLPPN